MGFYPSIGKPKVFARAQVAAIVRTPGQKGITNIEFRAHDGTVLFIADDFFGHADMQHFADYLHVPLKWKL